MLVLLLEDAQTPRQNLLSLFQSLPGVGEVRVAELVAEARRMCQDFVPDLAVLDALLPDGNGMELIPELRRANSQATVVVLSHYPDIHADQSEQAGADHFFDKSLGLDCLGRQLAELISRQAANKREGVHS